MKLLKYSLTITCLFSVTTLFSQGYFYTEGTVQVNNGASIEIKGDAEINSAIAGDGLMVMAGDNPQDLGGSSASMNNLSVTNSAMVSLVDPAWVLDTLHMVNGTLFLHDENLFLGDSSYHTGSATGFVNTSGTGSMYRMLDSNAFTFHTGWGSAYFPVTLQEFGTADTFMIKGWDVITDDGTYGGVPITTHVALLSYNVMDMIPGGNDITLTMQWRDAENAVDFVQEYAIGIWYDGGGFAELDNCPTNVSGMDPNMVSYNGITNTGTFGIGDSVYLSNIPSASITPGDTAVCDGDMVTFTASPSGAPAYEWSTTETTQSIDVTTTGVYWVNITDSTGCVYQSNNVNFTAWPLPPAPTIFQNMNMLSVNPVYVTYQWYLDGSPIGGATLPDYTVTGNGSYTCVVTDTNGCSNTSPPFVFNTFSLNEINPDEVVIVGMTQQVYIGLEPDVQVTVSIFDVMGRVVYQGIYNNNYISLPVRPGMYVARLDAANWHHSRKVMIQ